MKRSKAAKWRTIVLIALHVFMAAHIVHWAMGNRTVSPIEPSESMQTLELGLVNAGAVFFALALLTTAIFGRFVCGWACHIVALQDACYWMLRKVGLRPKPFRSRLLMLIPLGLALYMFVWPTLAREVLVPAFDAAGWAWPSVLRKPPALPPFESEMIVEDFWATFPAWYIAIPFLFVCGFAVVYFLGAKGFCTYGCPYGGFFAPVEAVAPVRIKVDHDKCEGCGHCTASCTSNVRVHEEIRDYGMVVDPGCMRCLDCVSVCPNDALYVGLGRPPILAPKPKDEAQAASRKAAKAKRNRRYDLTPIEEAAAAVIWLALFVSLRGFLDSTPMLMAVGLASIGTYLLWKTWSLAFRSNVRIHGWTLKNNGKLKASAAAFAVVILGLVTTSAWSGVVRFNRWSGVHQRAEVQTPFEVLMRPEFEAGPTARRNAIQALNALTRADDPDHGGFGWGLNADLLVERAYLEAVLGDFETSANTLERVVETGNPTSDLLIQLGQLHARAGVDQERTREVFERALELHPDLHIVREQLATAALSRGDQDAAETLWAEASDDTEDPTRWLAEARYRLAARDAAGATEAADRAVEIAGAHVGAGTVGQLMSIGQVFVTTGDTSRLGDIETRVLADDAISTHDTATDTIARSLASARLAGVRQAPDLMVERLREVDEDLLDAGTAAQLREAAQLWFALGQVGDGERLLDRAGEVSSDDEWALSSLAGLWGQIAQETRSLPTLEKAITLMRQAVALNPESTVLRHDLAVTLLSAGRVEEAAEQLAVACEQTLDNVVLPERLAQVYAQLGNLSESERWREVAASRR